MRLLRRAAVAAWNGCAFEGVQPVSPALRCVVLLTTIFFSVYLMAVLARLATVALSFLTPKQSHTPRCEIALAHATDALALAPMLCVLMMSTRLRAMQLELQNGDPPDWVQWCTYADTAAFFLRFLFDVALRETPWAVHIPSWVFRSAYCLASAVVCGASVALVVGIFSMKSAGARATPAPLPMMPCMTALAVSYILECLVLEAIKLLCSFRLNAGPKSMEKMGVWFREEEEKRVSGSSIDNPGGGSSAGGMEMYDRLMSALAERRHTDTREPLAMEAVFFQFPLMQCVLLVGINMRAVQLHLTPPLWACVAMYVTAGAIVLWAVWGVATSAAAAAAAAAAATSSAPTPLRGHTSIGPPAFGSRRGLARAAPESSAVRAGTVGVSCLSACWVALLGIVYLGTALIIASVFGMEPRPFSILWPEAMHITLLRARARARNPFTPEISTAMHCVMLLTVVYFGVHLCLSVSRTACAPVRKWASSVFGSIQRSLAFAPMLCVMMIAVRMRAMQLHVRDPQAWAQGAMYVATFSIIIQVGCSLYPDAWDCESTVFDETVLVGKVAAIVLLVLRHAASASLYAAISALVAALLVMEPEIG